MSGPRRPSLLIAGATGHTGSRLAREALRRGYPVRVLSRSRDKALHRLGTDFSERVIEGDLSQPESIGEGGEGCEALISAAHIRLAPGVITLCRKAGIQRAVFMSSARRHTRFPDETSERVVAGEQTVRQSDLDYTIIRPTMIFGGPDDQNLTRLLRWIERFPILPVPGRGQNLVQPVFVLDLVDALLKALDRAGREPRVFDLAGPEPIRYIDMLHIMARAAGKRRFFPPIPLTPAMWLIRLYNQLTPAARITPDQIGRFREDKTVDISLARRELDYRPTPFAEAMARKIRGEV